MDNVRMTWAWAETLVRAWHDRRGDDGGILDEVAMMGALAAAAIIIGGIVAAFLTGKVNSINIGW
jgi:hypothetical protein